VRIVIAEKPKVAQKIASIFKGLKLTPYKKIRYFKGDDLAVISAVGHVYNLAETKKSYQYPVFDIEWKPAYLANKSAAYTKDYVELAQKLAPKAKEVIVATDYDTEGSLIGYNLARFTMPGKPLYRMKFSSITLPELKKAWENLQEFDYNNAFAGEARHTIDWFYGINLSRALMSALKKAGMFKILSIGRVQGPTLDLVVKREHEIRDFKPEIYYVVKAKGKGVEFDYGKRMSKEEAQEVYDRIGKYATVVDIENKEVEVMPPVPFDLTTLQTEAYRIHGITPAQTLKLAQALYEEGLISYPRTSSQKYPPTLPIRNILSQLEIHQEYAERLLGKGRLRPVQGKKEDPAHPAIYPTGNYKPLEGQAKKLYDLIVRRFLATLSPPARKAITTVTIESNGVKLKAKGERILEPGFMEIYPYVSLKKELPDFEHGETFPITKKLSKEQTKPPARYNEASLVKELEKKNLGTKATRAVIVSTLFDRDYLTKEGKHILPTEFGEVVREVLKENVPTILDEELTRSLEKKIEGIQEGKMDKEEVIDEAKEIVYNISQEFKEKEEKIGKELLNAFRAYSDKQEVLGKHVCGGNLRLKKGKKNYYLWCDKCKEAHPLPPGVPFKIKDNKLMMKKGRRFVEFRNEQIDSMLA